jgi:hypothetical protein
LEEPNMKNADPLAHITIDLARGTFSYEKPEGFELDQERMYSTARLFATHCPTVEQAVRLAIHQQISAYNGAQTLMRRR